jgi:hypothetical protein
MKTQTIIKDENRVETNKDENEKSGKMALVRRVVN